ncbi:hypothetical protein P5V15_001376 [Pogonomyrmex californicus]
MADGVGTPTHVAQDGGWQVLSALGRDNVKEIGAYNCQKIHETGSLAIGTAFVNRLINNATNHRSVMLAGQAFTDGRCAGTQYTDGYGTWENVVVQAAVEITLRTFTMPFKRSISKVNLPSGTCHVPAPRVPLVMSNIDRIVTSVTHGQFVSENKPTLNVKAAIILSHKCDSWSVVSESRQTLNVKAAIILSHKCDS